MVKKVQMSETNYGKGAVMEIVIISVHFVNIMINNLYEYYNY